MPNSPILVPTHTMLNASQTSDSGYFIVVYRQALISDHFYFDPRSHTPSSKLIHSEFHGRSPWNFNFLNLKPRFWPLLLLLQWLTFLMRGAKRLSQRPTGLCAFTLWKISIQPTISSLTTVSMRAGRRYALYFNVHFISQMVKFSSENVRSVAEPFSDGFSPFEIWNER